MAIRTAHICAIGDRVQVSHRVPKSRCDGNDPFLFVNFLTRSINGPGRPLETAQLVNGVLKIRDFIFRRAPVDRSAGSTDSADASQL